MPSAIVPLAKGPKGLTLASKFGDVLQPLTCQPPIFQPFQYAMKNFCEFLEAAGWAGVIFGAIQLQFAQTEEDGSWWKGTKSGSIRKAHTQFFETRIQTLQPTGLPTSQAFQHVSDATARRDKSAAFENWVEALKDKKEWQSTAVDSWELWATELDGKGQRNKPYGVDTSGGSTEHCTADSIHVWLTVT
jgi:hypothetical protein